MRIITASLLLLSLAACDGMGAKAPGATSDVVATTDSLAAEEISWVKKEIDFGKIEEGKKLDVEYHFKNNGTKPLVITKVEPSCGCTVAETPTEPIAPGKEGVIKGSFDSNGRLGTQHKSMNVYANIKGGPQELIFTVDVIK